MKKLVDHGNVKGINLYKKGSQILAVKKVGLKGIFHGEKCAIVVPSDCDFGIARIHGTLVGFKKADIYINVFRDIDEAMDWLEITLEAA